MVQIYSSFIIGNHLCVIVEHVCAVSLFQYKYTEGSAKERKALYNGMEKLQEKTFDMEFTVMEAEYEFGEDVVFTVKAHNKAEHKRIHGKIVCTAVTYTGRCGAVRAGGHG